MSDNASQNKQKEIIDFLKRYIKSTLHSVTWDIEGEQLLKDRNKLTLTLDEKEKVKFLIALGTPKEYRANLWKTCSGAKRDVEERNLYYMKLKKLSQSVPSLYEKQISSDIKRTNPKINSDPNFLKKLHQILTCYSIRNSSIGYCQGFNFIVCRLLEILKDEEDSFWVFCELIEEILPLNYYSELCGIMADTKIITFLIKNYFPQLKPILNNEMIEPLLENFIQQSLCGIFTTYLNEETSLLIWDFLFLEGNIVIIKTFIALFRCLENEFAKCDGSDNDLIIVKEILERSISNITVDSKLLIHSLIIKKFEFNDEYINNKRELISEVLCKELENKNLDTYQFKVKLNEEKLKMQLGKMCNRKWPYCMNDFYFENYKTVMPYLVISHQNAVPCCEEYFFKALNEMKSKNERKVYSIYGNEDEEKDVDEFDIIIERRQHYCEDVKKDNDDEGRKKEGESECNDKEMRSEVEESNDVQHDISHKTMTNTLLKAVEANTIMSDFKAEPFNDINEGNEI